MISLYCTGDKITMESGGGAATVNEIEALKSVSDLQLILSRDNIAPELFKQPDSPFLYDFFALEQVKDKHFDLAHFYSWTFSHTVRYLKDRGTKVSYTVAAHDRRVTVDEFHRLGLLYPFPHISDDNLFEVYSEGYRLADIVLTQSKGSAKLLKSFGCKRVELVPGGIHLPKAVKPIPNNFDVAYIGAIGPDKGLVYLIQAWGMLNYPNSRLVLAGWGTETLEPFIRQVTNTGNFALLGRVQDVADVYNACSLYIQPSVTEGFGLEVPEAMSYGRPVICSEGTGAVDCIDDGVDGFIVPIRDAKAIADRIDWLKRNREKVAEMGEKAKQKANRYTWDKIRRKYARIFSSLQSK